MRTLRAPTATSAANFLERQDAFDLWFDADVDAAASISFIIERFALNLERILGKQQTSDMFSQVPHLHKGWREGIENSDFWFETDLGAKLYKLTAYAVFGLIPQDPDFHKDIETIELILTDCPPEHWLAPLKTDALVPTVTMARARWNLDNGHGILPDGLALLGGVKLTRIRNMMSGNHPEIPKDASGMLSNDACRAWLESRDVFLPTIAYDLDNEQGHENGHATKVEPVFVPVARDGSWFGPGLKRNGHYQVGEKGSEQKISGYEEALDALQKMQTARWRRPNEEGNWGIVSAVEWRRVERSAL